MSDCVFALDKLSFAYPGHAALVDITLRIQAGQRIALLGANGSGKSTLLKLLDALYFASSGTLEAFGEVLDEAYFADETHNFRFRQRVGLVFQNPDVQIFNPSVWDEIVFGPLQLGWPRDKILQAAEAIMSRFGLHHLQDRPPHRLSGGEKKRVALASILILEPEVLLLDEPTAALDPESQSEVIRFMIDSQGAGRTLITATHDLEIITDIADYAFVLHQGRLVAEGTPEAILAEQQLLQDTGLAHAHWHRHANGELHRHQHSHAHHHAHDANASPRYRPRKA